MEIFTTCAKLTSGTETVKVVKVNVELYINNIVIINFLTESEHLLSF